MNKMTLDIQKFASVQTAKYEHRYLKLTVTEESTSIDDNTSTIKWVFESLDGDNAYYTIYNWSVKVAGQTIYKTQTTNWSTKEFPAKKGSKSGTITIAHKPDGTADPVAFTLTGKVYSSGTATFNGSLNLSTIPRASQPRISGNPTLGSAITIYTDRVSQSFAHTISYQFGGATGTIGTNVGDSISWTPPVSLAQQIPNSTSGAGIITCNTYNGGTLIGQKTVAFTASVPTNITPSISLSNPTIGGSAPTSWGIFVKGKSTASYTITGTGNQGSTISQYQSSVAGYSYTTANVTTGILYSPGTQTISAKVVDSRGRQATASKTFNVVDYYNPSFTTAQIQRVDVNGNLDDNGQYAKFNFAGSVSSCSGKNKGTFKIAYRVKNTGSYTEKTIKTNVQSINESYFITADGTSTGTKIQFSNNQSYDIKFMITDAFTTQESLQTLDTGFDLMNFNTSGQSMAIGKVSTRSANEKYLDVALNTKFEKDTQFDKNVTVTEELINYKELRGGGSEQNVAGYRLILTSSMGAWVNRRLLIACSGRHGGNGVYSIAFGCNNGTIARGNLHCKISYFGTPVDGSGSAVATNSIIAYAPADGSKIYFFAYFSDYDSTRYRVVQRWNCDIPNFTSGTWMTSIDTNTYGTELARTQINNASTITAGSRNTTGTWIPVFNQGKLDYTTRYIPNQKTHSQHDTEQDRLATLNMLSFWNGAYNAGNNSNLTYSTNGIIVGINSFTNASHDSSKFTLGASASKDGTITCSKAGYYPLALTGFRAITGDYGTYIAFAYCYMSGQTTGQCTVNFRIRNHRSANAGESYVRAYILWVKATE